MQMQKGNRKELSFSSEHSKSFHQLKPFSLSTKY